MDVINIYSLLGQPFLAARIQDVPSIPHYFSPNICLYPTNVRENWLVLKDRGVFASAAHTLKLDRYREYQHSPHARMTYKFMKCSLLKKKKKIPPPLPPKKTLDLAGVSPMKGIAPSASTTEPRGAAIQHYFPHRTFLPLPDFINPRACCKVQSPCVVWEMNTGFPNIVLGQEINPAEMFAMKEAHSWVDLKVVFQVLWFFFFFWFVSVFV